jgi:peptide deformylase
MIVHAGDPVLRAPARPVPAEMLGAPELIELIERMVVAMRAAPGVGLAAPQIGVGLRVLVMEDTAERMSHLSEEERRERARTDVPLTVVVNPVLESAAGGPETFFEGCLSVPGYSALVPRYREVVVAGVDARGEPLRLTASGWPARILQHELDHLDGKLYVDRMLTRSFATVEEIRARWAGKPLAEIAAGLGLSI